MMNNTKCRQAYPTDLTDKQWAEIAPLFTGMHKQKWDKRELVNAVFYGKDWLSVAELAQ